MEKRLWKNRRNRAIRANEKTTQNHSQGDTQAATLWLHMVALHLGYYTFKVRVK